MKRARQAEILNVIRMMDVETQEQLLAELKLRGFTTTQATISRDIHARAGLGGLLRPGRDGDRRDGGQSGGGRHRDAHHAGQRLGRGILQRSPQAAGVSLRQVRRGKDAFSASH